MPLQDRWMQDLKPMVFRKNAIVMISTGNRMMQIMPRFIERRNWIWYMIDLSSATGLKERKGSWSKRRKRIQGIREDGTGVTILGSYKTEEELNREHPTGNVGESYLVDGNLYVWTTYLASGKWDVFRVRKDRQEKQQQYGSELRPKKQEQRRLLKFGYRNRGGIWFRNSRGDSGEVTG